MTGVLLPLWLTNGVDTRLVRSQRTSYCDTRIISPHGKAVRQEETYANANEKYQRCWDKKQNKVIKDTGCSSAPKQLKVTSLPAFCPFHRDACLNGTESVVIENTDITYRDLGLKSRLKAKMNHRLTCTPVNLEPFIYNYRGDPVLTVYNVSEEWDGQLSRLDAGRSIALETLNGPNKRSKESSGWASLKRQVNQVEVLPLSDARPLHPYIETANATVFLALYRFGTTQFFKYPMDDPVFSAHMDQTEYFSDHLKLFPDAIWYLAPGEEGYFPDFEASAIGCVEVYQNCLWAHKHKQWRCTPYGKIIDWHRSLSMLPTDVVREVKDDFPDFTLIGLRTAGLLSVRTYAFWITMFTTYLNTFTYHEIIRGLNDTNLREMSKSRTLWRDEVVSWYLKTWWYAKFGI
ncbi:hypothetical protein AA313_de0202034 [Arthrobotrys entomopaga]|nr:hypothetical protein AA313_de0202034 [Arthrobotrys entomopaga]